jgi:RNA-splicing ligase RtcB
MLVYKLGVDAHDWSTYTLGKLDDAIRQYVPSGKNMHDHIVQPFPAWEKLYCSDQLKGTARIEQSIGTLGGGNHFIEVSIDIDGGASYLVIHSGSRNLGKQVADIYQKEANKQRTSGDRESLIEDAIQRLKAEGRSSEINSEIKRIKESFGSGIPMELSYLTGAWRERYLHDMRICQDYAMLNRETMAKIIVEHMGWEIEDSFCTVHNYIDLESHIVRKGAVSAKKGEKLIIPMNMRDGSLICVGKGNEDWNCSAPHGAGRLMSRSQAKRELSMSEFTDGMTGVFTTSVSEATLDESPMAYKPMQEIVDAIGDTVDIVARITPVYNFKASE